MADWHVRPAGSTYGAADGSTFENALAGNAGLAGVSPSPGDTVHIWGEHYERFVFGFSGAAGNPIRIYFEDGARCWPSVDETSGWSKATGYDVYYKSVSNGYHYALWADDELITPAPHDDSPGTRGTEAAAMTEGTWRMRGSTELMLYAPGGVDPGTLDSVRVSDRTIDDSYGALDLRGQNYLTVVDMNVRGARWNGGMSAAFVTEGDGITIVGGNVEHCDRICKVYGGAGFGIIGLNGDDLMSTGISLLGATSAGTPVSNPLSNVVIRMCRITNVGYYGRYRGIDWSITGDNDAIGIGYEGGNITNVEISDNYFGNIGPQWAKDADVPAYFTATDTDRGAGVYVGTSEVVAIDVTNLKILRNVFTGISRFSVHLGAECAGYAWVIGNLFKDTGRYIAFDATVLVQGTENSAFSAVVAHNTFLRALSRSCVMFRQADSDDSRYTYCNIFEQCDKVADASGESWQGDIWRYTTGAWAPSADAEDYNLHGLRSGLSSANIARDSGDSTYTSLAAYQSATTYADNSIQADPLLLDDDEIDADSPALGAGGNWWDALGVPPPQGRDGLRFMVPPAIGARELRPGKSGYPRKFGALPPRVLPAGVDICKARAA